MKKYLKLFRVKHYLKNVLIFLPIIFSKNILNINLLIKSIVAFIAFSLMASTIYIINDILDVQKDRNHPIKKKRPIASGEVNTKEATIVGVILYLVATICCFFIAKSINTLLLLFAYFILNVCYSYKLKHVPIADCFVLAIGFVIRVLYGASVIGVSVSSYLYLTILFAAFYVVLGKRRNEILKHGNEARSVLKFYSNEFLDKNMYVFYALTIVFYSMWCISLYMAPKTNLLLFSIPIVIFVLMRYSFNIEQNSEGDPVDVVLSDKVLLGSILLLGIYMMISLYVF